MSEQPQQLNQHQKEIIEMIEELSDGETPVFGIDQPANNPTHTQQHSQPQDSAVTTQSIEVQTQLQVKASEKSAGSPLSSQTKINISPSDISNMTQPELRQYLMMLATNPPTSSQKVVEPISIESSKDDIQQNEQHEQQHPALENQTPAQPITEQNVEPASNTNDTATLQESTVQQESGQENVVQPPQQEEKIVLEQIVPVVSTPQEHAEIVSQTPAQLQENTQYQVENINDQPPIITSVQAGQEQKHQQPTQNHVQSFTQPAEVMQKSKPIITVIDSEEEPQIQVPLKTPSPQVQVPPQPEQIKQTELNQQANSQQQQQQMSNPPSNLPGNLTIAQIKSMLLEACPTSKDVILAAPDQEIIQFYMDLTSSINTQINQQEPIQEQTNKQPTENHTQPIILEEATLQAPTIPETCQPEQPITQFVQPSKLTEKHAQQATTVQTTPIVPTAPTEQKSEQQKQLQIIVKALLQTTPELKDQIQKLSKEELITLYREGIQQEKRKEEQRQRNKNKKKGPQEIIDLEDETKSPQQTVITDKPLQQHVPAQQISRQAQQHEPVIHNQAVTNQPSQEKQPLKPSYSFLQQYKRRMKESKQSNQPVSSGSIYVNSTMLYELLQANDYQKKLQSILKPKQSVKYQQQTEKEVATLYLNCMKNNGINKGPFQTNNPKTSNYIIACKNKPKLNNEKFNKITREGLFVNVPQLSDEKIKRIIELRNAKNSALSQPSTNRQQPQQSQHNLSHPALIPTKRYCLIVEQLCPRQEEEIALQSNHKKVKKSGSIHDEQILSYLKGFEQIVQQTIVEE